MITNVTLEGQHFGFEVYDIDTSTNTSKVIEHFPYQADSTHELKLVVDVGELSTILFDGDSIGPTSDGPYWQFGLVDWENNIYRDTIKIKRSNDTSVAQGRTYAISYTTKPITLTPKITRQPYSATYVQGTTANPLTIEAEGGGILTYEWFKDNVSVGTEPSIEVNTDTLGTFNYFCRVTNTINGQTYTKDSNTVSIVISEKIYFNFNQVKTWTIPEGKVIKVECNGQVLWTGGVQPCILTWDKGISTDYASNVDADDVFDLYINGVRKQYQNAGSLDVHNGDVIKVVNRLINGKSYGTNFSNIKVNGVFQPTQDGSKTTYEFTVDGQTNIDITSSYTKDGSYTWADVNIDTLPLPPAEVVINTIGYSASTILNNKYNPLTIEVNDVKIEPDDSTNANIKKDISVTVGDTVTLYTRSVKNPILAGLAKKTNLYINGVQDTRAEASHKYGNGVMYTFTVSEDLANEGSFIKIDLSERNQESCEARVTSNPTSLLPPIA